MLLRPHLSTHQSVVGTLLVGGFAAALAQALPVAAADMCPVAEIVSPARGAFVEQPRPAIEWRALPGISRYRVQLESRVPEGRTLARFDTVVAGTRFVPPQNLTDSRAAVKVLVTADCGGDPVSVTESAAQFFMDLSVLCPAPDEIQISPGLVPALAWKPVKGAVRYEVSVFTVAESRLIAKEESLEPRFRFSKAPAVPYYASVRARCADAYSTAVYRVVAPAR